MLAEVAPGETAFTALIGLLVASLPFIVAWQGRKTRRQNTAEHQVNARYISEASDHLVKLHERVTDVGKTAEQARDASAASQAASEEAAKDARAAKAAASDACDRITGHLEWHDKQGDPTP